MRLTHHAVEQFASRWGGTEDQLRELVGQAVATKARTPRGQEIWLCGEDGAIRLVIKRDAGVREPVCVTVLPRDVEPPTPSVADLIADLPSSPVVESVPQADIHLKAAAAEVDSARQETLLASEFSMASRSFMTAAKARLIQAKHRLEQLRPRSQR